MNTKRWLSHPKYGFVCWTIDRKKTKWIRNNRTAHKISQRTHPQRFFVFLSFSLVYYHDCREIPHNVSKSVCACATSDSDDNWIVTITNRRHSFHLLCIGFQVRFRQRTFKNNDDTSLETQTEITFIYFFPILAYDFHFFFFFVLFWWLCWISAQNDNKQHNAVALLFLLNLLFE